MFRSLTRSGLCVLTAFCLGLALVNGLYALFSPTVHMPVF